MFTLRPLGCLPVMLVSGCGRLPPFPSDAHGLFHPAKCTATSARPICGSVGLRLPMIGGFGFASTIVLLGVGQPAYCTASDRCVTAVDPI